MEKNILQILKTESNKKCLGKMSLFTADVYFSVYNIFLCNAYISMYEKYSSLF